MTGEKSNSFCRLGEKPAGFPLFHLTKFFPLGMLTNERARAALPPALRAQRGPAKIFEGGFFRMALKQYEFWFVVGSQEL